MVSRQQQDKTIRETNTAYAAITVLRNAKININAGNSPTTTNSTKVEFAELFDGCIGVIPVFSDEESIRKIDKDVQIIELEITSKKK